MKTRRRWWVGGTLLVAAAAAAWYFWGGKPTAPPAAPSFSVRTAAVEIRAMPQVLQAVGKVLASASAEVRPQTNGVLQKVLIEDGARVSTGQPLFTLDAQPLAATLAQAKAQWARDKALADDAAATEARLKPLAAKEYVTAQEYQQALSTRNSLQAAASATRTQIEQARIALAYASIRAPIAGRAGAVLVKPGNLLAAGTTPLVVINAISPVELAFAVPQQQLGRLRDAMKAGALPVEARDSLTQKVRATGELVFIDNALSDSAGTLSVKARFANTDEALWPGEFYAVRVLLKTDAAAITVPEAALQQGQAGPYVYLVQDGKALLRPLQVDRVLDGRAVVAKGLAGGERVLVGVPNNLRDGSAVKVVADAASAAGSAPAAAASATAHRASAPR